jgi:hypothetical protein
MPSTSLSRRSSVDPADVRPVAFELVVLVAVVALVGLATLLPGADRTVPGTAVAIHELIVGLGALAVVVLLAHAARSVATLVRTVLEGPTRLVDDAGRVAGALVVFTAVLVAYRGFAGLVVPWLAAGDAAWAYDAGFLGLAIVPLGVIARRLRRNLDLLADQLAAVLADRTAGPESRPDA